MDGDADGGEIFCFGVQEVAGVNGCLSAMGKDVFFVFEFSMARSHTAVSGEFPVGARERPHEVFAWLVEGEF